MTKPKDDRGRAKGAPAHSDEQQGEATHSRFVEQLHESRAGQANDASATEQAGMQRGGEQRGND